MTRLAAPVLKPVVEIPKGTSELVWKIAASWARVSVPELLADTAPVKSAHYMSALRVVHDVECWLLAQDAEGDEDRAAALRAERVSAEGDPLAAAIIRDEEDHFTRLMLLAEGFAGLTATYRDSGDAALAAEYAGFETVLLQTAAKIQTMNDIQKVEK